MIDIICLRCKDITENCRVKTYYFDNRREAMYFLDYNWYNLELMSIHKLLVTNEKYKELFGKEVGEHD